MKRTNKSRHALLALLSLGPRSGYDIERDIRRTIGHFWSESYGQIYPALRAIVDDGLATVRKEPQDGKPDRKVYTITSEGRVSLRDWLREPPEPPPVRNEMLLKLFVGWQAPVETMEAHVRGLLEHFTHELEEYGVYERFLTRQARENPDALYWLMTLRSGQLYAEARRQWCEETLSMLARISKARRQKGPSVTARAKRMARLMVLAHERLPTAEKRARAPAVTS